MRRLLAVLLVLALALPALAQQPARPNNVILFVADGLRPGMVNERTAPAMAALMQRGVRFTNSHSLFPTFTTANASAMATGHYLGDTGDFSNNIYVGFPVQAAQQSPVAPLENNAVLAELDKQFGDFLNEDTILKLARDAGFSTAAMGKLGPTLIFDHTERTGTKTIIVDDATGHPRGIPLSDEVKQRLAAAQLPLEAPPLEGREQGTAGSGSPTSPPRRCCRCSRSAASRSCWSSGRAIPTPRSTARTTAPTGCCPASTGRARWPPSATPTTASPVCLRR